MKVVFRKSFERDLKKVNNRLVLEKIKEAVQEVEAAASLQSISSAKQLTGGGRFFRIRVGDYRIGIAATAEDPTKSEFVRCLHRREVYRYFS